MDAGKLSPDSPMAPSYRGRRSVFSSKIPVKTLCQGVSVDVLRKLVADVPKGHSYETVALTSTHMTVSQPVLSSRLGTTLRCEGLITTEGPDIATCICELSSETVGMGAVVVSYDTYQIMQQPDTQRKTIQGIWAPIASIMGCDAYVYQRKGMASRSIVVQLGFKSARGNAGIWAKVISNIYCQGILPTPIERYVSRDVMSKLSNLSSRAWDVSSPPDNGHTFTCKPDGERMWLLLYGKIWYMMRPRFNSGVLQWTVSSRSWLKDGAICLIDVEYLARHGLVLIDVLVDIGGKYASGIRDVHWVRDKFSYVAAGHACLNVNVRKYFNTFPEAMHYCTKVSYPTDGVVAIRNGSTEVSKIKTIKSMELLHEGHGVLKSADGIIIANSESAATFRSGSVIEVRFTLDSTTKMPNVLDMFERNDKLIANSYTAVANIISSCLVEQTPSDNERRVALLWCNELRRQLYIKAENKNPNKSIILDIGSGDGQALDVAAPTEDTSYIYVEPDTIKCKSLSRRLCRCELIENAEDIIPYLRSLKTRSIGSIILNNTLNSITDNDEVMDRLCPELKSATCTFSMHFVIKELHQLVAYKVPTYGCAYTYDTIDSAGVLLNTNGVVMRIVDDSTATVAWGGDKLYVEPVTRRRDYAGVAKVIQGADILQLPDGNISPGARVICSKVSVLLP